MKAALRSRDLHTVCEESLCPNIAECWGGGTATFMLLGDVCTRACRFCAVKTGKPSGAVDAEEPEKLAEAVAGLGLDYVVLTMVDRDDLPDGGAAHVARAVEALKRSDPSPLVEVLIGDLRGSETAVSRIVRSRPEVMAHNIETTEGLTPRVRDARASYAQSLRVLEAVKRFDGARCTKSSIMLGLGETEADVCRAFDDLRSVGVDILTLGQYLRPTARHLPVVEYLPPDRFDRYRALAEARGFLYVASGPLVRSSYRAGEFFVRNVLRRKRIDGAETGAP